ncbi:MAG: 50S ribosomal protein L6 [Candidatus Pacebacteria bacterium]|nr:50S ribosomal protein L6 [Candidatus Paceibacterota bacterium]NUQ57181.1 50S ribosomal protein L6 [Candidatus Paceibacter sp.]
MSHIGKKEIIIPEKVEMSLKDGVVSVKGPLGEIKKDFKTDDVTIAIENKTVSFKLKKNPKNKAMWGTCAAYVNNMIKGVTAGFEKKLTIEGIGYKAQTEGNKLSLTVGLSHPVKLDIPEGVKVKVEKNLISVTGFDKDKVGQFSADVRAVKKPEPYKGTGIKYENEVIRRKAGKKAATAAA